MLTCPTAGNVNFDHPVKVVSARFLHHKLTFFSLLIDKYFARRYP